MVFGGVEEIPTSTGPGMIGALLTGAAPGATDGSATQQAGTNDSGQLPATSVGPDLGETRTCSKILIEKDTTITLTLIYIKGQTNDTKF